jgi:mono/diheme cytochrome c family protein
LLYRPSLKSVACVAVLVTATSVLVAADATTVAPVVLPRAADGAGAQLDDVLMGEVLLSELGCVNCHVPHADERRAPARRGPDLTAVRSRLRVNYLRAFLRMPHTAEPGTVMPDVLARENREAVVDSIIAQLPPPVENSALPLAGSLENGRRLYHLVGCVMCHAPEDGVRPAAFPERVEMPVPSGQSVPLGDLAAKYTRAGLVGFLLDPLLVRPSGRMPSFHLEPAEASDIAAYLQRGDVSELSPVAAAASKGTAAQVSIATCAACHDGVEATESFAAPPLVGLDPNAERGCLAAAATGAFYPLSSRQRATLRAALQYRQSHRFPDGSTSIHAALVGARCVACHRRGDERPELTRALWLASTSEQDLGPEGRVPPPLDGVGSKLNATTLAAMIRGADPVRPYLQTRMPDFGSVLAEWLTPRLAAQDRRADEKSIVRSGRNMWGRHLVGTAGLSCIVCHDLAGKPSLGIPALDLASVPRRLRVEWFHEYMVDPARFREGTRMPTFWPEGKAALRNYLGGNTKRQVDSLWVYLMEIDQTRLPVGLESQEEFEIVPDNRPVVFRTFLERVGVHAIAVGFPAGVHYAFDALTPRLALLWKGRFLDAESTWDDRFTPLTAPLGTGLQVLPDGALLARLTAFDQPWPVAAEPDATRLGRMRGYRLDEGGIPTFLYRVADVEVAERLSPLELPEGVRGFRRVLELSELRGAAGRLWLRAAVSSKFQPVGDTAWMTSEGLTLTLPETYGSARQRDSSGKKELLIPVPSAGASAARLIMEWAW